MMKNSHNKPPQKPSGHRLRYLHTIVENYRRIRANMAMATPKLPHRRGQCSAG